MSFYEIIEKYSDFDFEGYFSQVSERDIERSLYKDRLSEMDFLNLLSDKAETYLEVMAQKAHQLTVQYFGRTISLYLPIYISNYCTNECLYCGFNLKNKISRKKLTLDEIEAEAKEIAKTEIRHILMLTGEAREKTSMDYILDAVEILKRYFSSVSIEMFPMDESEYVEMKKTGVDGLTIYQEVYNREIYKKVHLSGKKTDYRYRLDAPERGAKAGFRMVNVGALMGLGEKRSETFFTAMHAKYIEDRYMDTEVSISLPRIRGAESSYEPYCSVDDRDFVQFMLAFRIFLPRAGITVSTREDEAFRDRLIYLGATRFSAGSKTEVGGYTVNKEKETPQFEISDDRSIEEIVHVIKSSGYQPVFKDWELLS